MDFVSFLAIEKRFYSVYKGPIGSRISNVLKNYKEFL